LNSPVRSATHTRTFPDDDPNSNATAALVIATADLVIAMADLAPSDPVMVMENQARDQPQSILAGSVPMVGPVTVMGVLRIDQPRSILAGLVLMVGPVIVMDVLRIGPTLSILAGLVLMDAPMIVTGDLVIATAVRNNLFANCRADSIFAPTASICFQVGVNPM